MKAAVAERPARLRLVADRGRLLPQERAVPPQAAPRWAPREQVVPRRPPQRQAVPRRVPAGRAPARRATARPGRIPRNPAPERTPIRLTRRGHAVVAVAVVMLVGAVSLALVLWVPTG